jgi:hypothetical protein
MSFQGHIAAGCGSAAAYLTSRPDALAARSAAAGVDLFPGTLNLRVDDVDAAVAALGAPDFLTDRDNKRLGPLQWWAVALGCGTEWAAGFVVRHGRTRTRYVEAMASGRLRDMGWQDGDEVTVERANRERGVRRVVALAAFINHRWWAPFDWLPAEARPHRRLADSDLIWEHMDADDFRGASVLDFGCHEGYHAFRALRAGAASALGVDKTERVVTIARAINAHIERSAAEFLVANSLDGLPDADVVMSLSVWHQIDPTYERLGEHIAALRAKAGRCVYLDLIAPPLEGDRDTDAIVEGAGGAVVWHRRHPVRCSRTLYRIAR